MKFKINAFGQDVIVSFEQLETVFNTLIGCETLHPEFVGAGKGDGGGSYVAKLRPFNPERAAAHLLTDDTVDAMRLVTRLSDDRDAKN